MTSLLRYPRVGSTNASCDTVSLTAHVTSPFRYPRAGSTNASSALKLLEFRLDTAGGQTVTGLTRRHLLTPLASMFPWMEYLVRVGWFDEQL